ncbi:MAG: hypothetical protein K0R87_1229 [Pseudonocardia sp.]|nr:hypothetical protein [Pseudonocardia sp.]
MAFAEYLSGLDTAALTALLEQRRDVLQEPAPASILELAQRLEAFPSLYAALGRADRDEVVVIQSVALGARGIPAVADRLQCPPERVRAVVDGLSSRGVAWRTGDRIRLPGRLAEWFTGPLQRFRPLKLIASQTGIDELRTAVTGLGADPADLRKAELTHRLAALYADPGVVGRAVDALPPSAREQFDLIRAGGVVPASAVLVRAGLLLATPHYLPEVPREVEVAILRGTRRALTGPPELPASTATPDDGRAGAEAALLALTSLLDDARRSPLPALKRGGVGVRERGRLTKRVGVVEPALWIDVAFEAGLLGRMMAGYGPSDEYDAWRAGSTTQRWATAALAWFALEPAPTSRETDDGEVPPPEQLHSWGGMVRRALLRAAAGGRSLRAAQAEIGWFCPLAHYDDAGLKRKLAAAVREAELMGVISGDRLSALGEELVAAADRADAVDVLAASSAALLPDSSARLVLQSDLTALVSGQPSAAAASLLAEAAVLETRGPAATWRFSQQSVRSALDQGWSADELLARLAEISERPVPQPLTYLVADVARRHGAVRVRGVQCCVTGSAPEIAEILATRSLSALQLSRLAPTVLSSPFDPKVVVAALRKAGFMPMPEDGKGVVVLPREAPAISRQVYAREPQRRRVDAAELAARLTRSSAAATGGDDQLAFSLT